jgi:hypothetical protein
MMMMGFEPDEANSNRVNENREVRERERSKSCCCCFFLLRQRQCVVEEWNGVDE